MKTEGTGGTGSTGGHIVLDTLRSDSI